MTFRTFILTSTAVAAMAIASPAYAQDQTTTNTMPAKSDSDTHAMHHVVMHHRHVMHHHHVVHHAMRTGGGETARLNREQLEAHHGMHAGSGSSMSGMTPGEENADKMRKTNMMKDDQMITPADRHAPPGKDINPNAGSSTGH